MPIREFHQHLDSLFIWSKRIQVKTIVRRCLAQYLEWGGNQDRVGRLDIQVEADLRRFEAIGRGLDLGHECVIAGFGQLRGILEAVYMSQRAEKFLGIRQAPIPGIGEQGTACPLGQVLEGGDAGVIEIGLRIDQPDVDAHFREGCLGGQRINHIKGALLHVGRQKQDHSFHAWPGRGGGRQVNRKRQGLQAGNHRTRVRLEGREIDQPAGGGIVRKQGTDRSCQAHIVRAVSWSSLAPGLQSLHDLVVTRGPTGVPDCHRGAGVDRDHKLDPDLHFFYLVRLTRLAIFHDRHVSRIQPADELTLGIIDIH